MDMLKDLPTPIPQANHPEHYAKQGEMRLNASRQASARLRGGLGRRNSCRNVVKLEHDKAIHNRLRHLVLIFVCDCVCVCVCVCVLDE